MNTKAGLLTRYETSDEGTFGILEVGAFVCHTIELPWRENRTGRSCVPSGKYLFRKFMSPKHGECLAEWDDPSTPAKEDVPGRTDIQIHSANLAGDVDKGWVSQLLGCIAPGTSVSTFKAGFYPAAAKDQKGVTASRAALRKLLDEVGDDVLSLTICWKEGVLDKPGSPGGY